MQLICFNGEFVEADEPVLKVQNRSFKWGDGMFETMKVQQGQIHLEAWHFERLFFSLHLLEFDTHDFFPALIREQVIDLCEKNDCEELARVRLGIYRDPENKPGYVIEAQPLDESNNLLNEKGLALTIYPYARKSMDGFSNLKTANFLPYVMASRYAKENHCDDAIVLNAENKICDSSRANIFIIKGNEIFTPALHQGCVNGVMRRLVIEELPALGYPVHQISMMEDDLLNADEVFLTNSIYGIRWVGKFKTRTFPNKQTVSIYNKLPGITASY